MTPELHRPVATDRIGPDGLSVTVEAREPERIALARRLGLPALLSLRCSFDLRRMPGEAFGAEGRLEARVVQTCVVSLEEFEADIDEVFSIRFVPEGSESDDLDPDSPDEIPYANGFIDLGEAAAEQIALSLDPYPRRPGAVIPGTEGEVPLHPFAVLAALKRSH